MKSDYLFEILLLAICSKTDSEATAIVATIQAPERNLFLKVYCPWASMGWSLKNLLRINVISVVQWVNYNTIDTLCYLQLLLNRDI